MNKFSLQFSEHYPGDIKFHHNGYRVLLITFNELSSESKLFRVPRIDNFYVYKNFHRRMRMSGEVKFE